MTRINVSASDRLASYLLRNASSVRVQERDNRYTGKYMDSSTSRDHSGNTVVCMILYVAMLVVAIPRLKRVIMILRERGVDNKTSLELIHCTTSP